MIRLATTSFVYPALCAVIWLTGFDAADAKATLEGAAASAKPLVMPFALLLVAAHRQAGNTKAAASSEVAAVTHCGRRGT